MSHNTRQEEVIKRIELATEAAKQLSRSREASCVMTKLDEARMWAQEIPDNGE